MGEIPHGGEEIAEVWRSVTAAFAFYGKQVRPLKGKRLDLVKRLMAGGYTAEELVACVHGYVHFHSGLAKKPDGWEPLRYFTPESVFRLEKLEPRCELGMAGPWRKPETASERRDREREAEYRAEREKVLEERRGLLRSVR